VSKKRIKIEPDFMTWLSASVGVLPVVEVPLTFEVLRALPVLGMPHDDLADLFLAATAKAFDLPLITADRKFIRG
jgi:PIN domain nuclease of toxin-antitoxin system